MAELNAQYNVAAPDSLPIRIVAHMRRRMFQRFLDLAEVTEHDEILDVGATSDQTYDSSNYLEAWYAHKSRLTAVGLDDAAFLEQLHPGVKVCRADGRALPFRDDSFDVVHSSAVLEHVGSAAEQGRFLAELYRVCRRVVFVTTPNRWFPVEFHSSLPLVHWLPKRLFRTILKRIGHDVLSQESNLNLLSARELLALASQSGVRAVAVHSVRLLGWPSNLLLVMSKHPK